MLLCTRRSLSDFDSYDTGIESHYRGFTGNSTTSLTLKKSFNISETDKTYYIYFECRTDNSGYNFDDVYIKFSGSSYFNHYFNSIWGFAINRGTAKTTQSYTCLKWSKVCYVVNTSTGYYEIFLDGESIYNDTNTNFKGVSLSSIECIVKRSFYLRNIVVSDEEFDYTNIESVLPEDDMTEDTEHTCFYTVDKNIFTTNSFINSNNGYLSYNDGTSYPIIDLGYYGNDILYISYEIYLDSNTNAYHFICKNSSNSTLWSNYSSTSPAVTFKDYNDSTQYSEKVISGTWNKVYEIYDMINRTVKMYINGELCYTADSTSIKAGAVAQIQLRSPNDSTRLRNIIVSDIKFTNNATIQVSTPNIESEWEVSDNIFSTDIVNKKITLTPNIDNILSNPDNKILSYEVNIDCIGGNEVDKIEFGGIEYNLDSQIQTIQYKQYLNSTPESINIISEKEE